MRSLWLLFLVGLATGFISEKLLVSSQSPFPAADDLYLEGRTSGDLTIDDEDGGSGSGSGDYAFSDIAYREEIPRRFLNFSKTTVSNEMVPGQPQSTADSHNPPTTAAVSQDQTTTVRTTPYTFPDGDNRDEEVPDIVVDWFTESASPSSTSKPPSETTENKFSIDISVTKGSNGDNSLHGDETVLIKEEVDSDVLDKAQDKRYGMDSPEEVTSENLWERTEVLAAVIACGVIGFLCAVFLLLLLAYRMKKKDEGSYDLGDTKLSTTAYHKAPTKEFYA